MWSGGDDFSEQGEPIRLYQPIPYGRKPAQDDLTCSFIGGSTPSSINQLCGLCQNPLHLLVQLHLPKSSASAGTTPAFNRTLQVLACNRAACINSLFVNGKLASGDKVVVCRRFIVNTKAVTTGEQQKVEPALPPSSWMDETDPGTGEVDANDWAVDESADMEELEAKLAAMENSEPSSSSSKPSATKREQKTNKGDAFPCFVLQSSVEPVVARYEGLDDDDVGISGSPDKIQQMLARYMAEEEDQDILAVLKNATGGGGGQGISEKEERLSAADRALLTFSDRLKRRPRQVLRYAYGGVPLWSIPVESPQNQPNRHQKQPPTKTNKVSTLEPSIPPCSCGAARVFEMQLLPSLLHILEVDKLAKASTGGIQDAYNNGGMNWGNIAVYSCSQECSSEFEYVIVQESVDEQPIDPGHALQGDVLISDDAQFVDEDSEEDNDEMICHDDDDNCDMDGDEKW